MRAIVPEKTPYLACTATATKSIREEVLKSLDMYDCDFVFTSPDRPNIFYEVRPRTEIDLDMKPFLCSLKNDLVKAPRVIVYCKSLNLCADETIIENVTSCAVLCLLFTADELYCRV